MLAVSENVMVGKVFHYAAVLLELATDAGERNGLGSNCFVLHIIALIKADVISDMRHQPPTLTYLCTQTNVEGIEL